MMEQLSPLIGDASRPTAPESTAAESRILDAPAVVPRPREVAGERAPERAPIDPRAAASTEDPTTAAPEVREVDAPPVVSPRTGMVEGRAPECPLVDTRPSEAVVEPTPSAPEPGSVERPAVAVEADVTASEERRSSAEDPTTVAGEAPVDPPLTVAPEVVVIEDVAGEDGSPERTVAGDVGAPALNLPGTGQRAEAALFEPSPTPGEPSAAGAGVEPSSSSAVFDDPLALGAGRKRPRGDPKERAAFQRLLTAGQVRLLQSFSTLPS